MARINIFLLIFILNFFNAVHAQKITVIVKSVRIGNQIWMTENVNVPIFNNGESILHAQSDQEWEEAGFKKIPAWCYQSMDTISAPFQRPKLYNRYVINDNRNVCPVGWHIATNKDWNELISYYKGEKLAGKYLKASSWIDSTKYNNIFSAIPVGWRDVGFGDFGTQANWWSKDTTEDGANYYYFIFSNASSVIKYNTSWINGFSIRCVKD